MKRLIFLLMVIFIASCSREEICEDQFGNTVDCDLAINNVNGNSNNNQNTSNAQLAESEFMRQTALVTFNLNSETITIPLRTQGISTNIFSATINIIQDGLEFPGVYDLEQSGNNFIAGTYQLPEDFPLTNSNNIVVELFIAETGTSTRSLVDSINLN